MNYSTISLNVTYLNSTTHLEYEYSSDVTIPAYSIMVDIVKDIRKEIPLSHMHDNIHFLSVIKQVNEFISKTN